MSTEILRLGVPRLDDLSNRQVIKQVVNFDCCIYLCRSRFQLDKPIRVTYLDGRREDAFFPVIDFTAPLFLGAIDETFVPTMRDILDSAPSRGIETAIRQLIGRDIDRIVAHGLAAVFGPAASSQHAPFTPELERAPSEPRREAQILQLDAFRTVPRPAFGRAGP